VVELSTTKTMTGERGRRGVLEEWIGEREARGMREFWEGEWIVE